MAQNRTKFHFDNMYDEVSGIATPFIVYQAGDLNCEGDYHVPLHKQTVYEVSYIFSGNGIFFTNKKEYSVTKNTVFLNKIGDEHEIISSKQNPLRYFYLGFKFAEPCNEDSTIELRRFFDTLKNPVRYDVESISDLFLKLFAEITSQDSVSKLTTAGYISIILSTVYRTFLQLSYYPHTINNRAVFDAKLVYDIASYIDTNIESISSLSILSDEFGYSYSTIAKKFMLVMGENLKAYHTKRRFARAKELLDKNMDVTQVAELMGYNSIHSFTRAFHKYCEIPPSIYKKKGANGS